MAQDSIRRIFFTPTVAIARLGGSLTPLEAFDWGPGHPHTVAETRIRPTWTLDVLPDGSVSPRLPRQLTLRDGALLRPVAPFFELWALTGDGDVATAWRPVPVTLGLLQANGATTSGLAFTIDAMNRKAERRAPRGGAIRPSNLRFGTFPPVVLPGNDHRAVDLPGVSPPDASPRMIPRGRNIPLGRLQVLRPVPQPAAPAWPQDVRTDVVRVRFTPARGRFYGPPEAARTGPGRPVPAVPRGQDFLNPQAGWFNAPQSDRTTPGDTFDEVSSGVSLGVVDDTCDARLEASLTLAGTSLRCTANISVGPPDYASDRRPFLSLADEINDREHDRRRDQALTDEQRAEWVEDLFERVYETVSLFDVDWWRAYAARPLPANEQRPPIPGDGVPQPTRAMGGRDRLRDPNIPVPAPSAGLAQPLSQRARDRHRNLSDLGELRTLVRANPNRIAELVRTPLSSPPPGFDQSMQMPPFMRNSNAGALSLARWQYDLLLAWVAAVTAQARAGLAADDGIALGEAAALGEPAALSPAAAERRRQILAMLDAGAEQ